MADLTFPFYLGPYKVVSTLGTGGFATVYKAVVEGGMGFSREVALKVLHGHITRSDPRVVTMLADEALLLARMQHPNIVYVQWFGQLEHPVDGAVFAMMMEYVPGKTLRQVADMARATGEPIPLSVALDVHLDMLRGLRFAHELKATDGTPLGLVHRDLKPDNVIISAEGAVKLLDFGIAKASERLVEKTETNMIRGTVHYMSPEQVRGEDLDFRSDLFSFGAMLCEALTGRRVIHGQTLIAAMHAVASFQSDETLDSVRKVLPSAAPFVARLIAPARGDRFASTAEAVASLQRLRDGVPTSEMSSSFLTRQVTAIGPAESFGDDETEARPAPAMPPRASGPASPAPASSAFGTSGPSQAASAEPTRAQPVVRAAEAKARPRRSGRVAAAAVGAMALVFGVWSLLRPVEPPGGGDLGAGAPGASARPNGGASPRLEGDAPTPFEGGGPSKLEPQPDLAEGLVMAAVEPAAQAALKPAATSSPAPAPAIARSGPTGGAQRPSPTPEPVRAPTPEPTVTPAPAVGEPGLLKIGADKPFELSIATRRYKQLEAAKGIRLPPGTYRVRLDCLQCDAGTDPVRELSLEVVAGGETRRTVRFADAP